MSKNANFPIVLVKNLPYGTSSESLYELLGRYGNISQIRVPEAGSSSAMGTCIVVYNNMANANRAVSEVNGINFQGRYLVASLFQVDPSHISSEDFISRKAHIEELKKEYGVE